MARSDDRSFANALSDLKTFAQMNQIREDSGVDMSLRKIALRMEVSPTTLVECLRRLNQRYPVEIAETSEAIKSFRITEAGRVILDGAKKLFEDFSELERKMESRGIPEGFSARIGASPYLLSTIMPSAVMDCVHAFKGRGGITINCEEAYDSEDFLKKIHQGVLDFAVIWDYQDRARLIKKEVGLDCVYSRKEFDALAVFGPNHNYYKRLKNKEIDYVNIGEFSTEQLYILREGHRFLDRELPVAQVAKGAKRIESYSIASMLGSIRSGMLGVAIVPSFYKDLDRFRRDGSLGYLPLRSADGKRLKLRILYAFRSGEKESDAKVSVGIGAMDAPAIPMRNGAKESAKYIERTLIEQPERSGWQIEEAKKTEGSQGVSGPLAECFLNIKRFKYCYYISSGRIGIDRPVWHFATADFYLVEPANSERYRRVENGNDVDDDIEFSDGLHLAGGFATHMPDVEDDIYKVRGQLFKDRVIVIRGIQSSGPSRDTVPDAFVAALNFVAQDESALIGTWTGRDRSAESSMAGPMILSKEMLNPSEVKKLVHGAMVRQLTSVTGSFSASFDEIFRTRDLPG